MATIRYRTVRVPEWVYDNAQAIRQDIVQHGLDFVPTDLVKPDACPRCGGAVDHLVVGVEHVECGECGYKQQSVLVSGNRAAGIGIGLVLGLGLGALAGYALAKSASSKPQPAKRPARKRLPAKRSASKRPTR